MFDTRITTGDKKIKNPNFELTKILNPDKRKMGLAGINIESAREKSVSELAQNSNIWDPEKNEFLDYSPNDRSLENSIIIFVSKYSIIALLPNPSCLNPVILLKEINPRDCKCNNFS